MDNGTPWGTPNQLPSAFGLWLVGLGITPVYGRPRHPTDNGVVERDQGVLAQWVEPQTCADFATCQAQLQWAVDTQRERYHLPGQLTRRQAYPDLYQNQRPYQATTDQAVWQLERVLGYIACLTFQRKVELNGRITLFANPYAVGTAYAHQYVEVKLDSLSAEWVIADQYAHELRRHPNQEFTYEQISQLTLAKRRKNR